MTPEAKQKADEIVEKFFAIKLYNKHAATQEEIKHATQCAIICVEEIIKEQESWIRVLKKNNIIEESADGSELNLWQSILSYLKSKQCPT